MSYSYNNKYIMKDNKPYFPVMGEIHYSRYPEKYWKESLYKMKAGGLTMVSSYVIWIHHEEIENQYDFTGNRNLRRFLTDCKECGVEMVLRIGPWCHGEVRNGGFPDWLLKKNFAARTNDDRYFEHVRKYYSEIFKHVEGLLYKDGGPVVGIQIENEYGHCGGLSGEDGELHMKTLHKIAVEAGFDVDLYTATGWGGAVTGGLLPVMGGYCEAPWDQRLTEIEPSGNYIITLERNDHNIGSDLGLGSGLTFDTTKFPYLTAELGGGLQVTSHRRPVASAEDIGAMSLAKLGSGVTLLGYYMYHGGTNPKGKITTLQESRDTGYANNLPEFSYDFNAPIREYGQMSDTLKELKLFAYFAKEFGEKLCKSETVIPEDNPLDPCDTENVRYSFRYNPEEESGFLFVNNYVRHRKMKDHNNVNINFKNNKFEFSLDNGEYFFCPFNLEIGNTVLESTLASPLCKLNFEGDNKEYKGAVFYTDKQTEFKFSKEPDFKVIVLNREEAKNAWKVKLDKEYLFICEGSVIETDKNVCIISRDVPQFMSYPRLLQIPTGFTEKSMKEGFFSYNKSIEMPKASGDIKLISDENKIKRYKIDLDIEGAYDDIFVLIDYSGSKMKLYIDGEYVGDHFYTGQIREIGLKQFDFPKEIEVEIYPLKKGEHVFLDKWPEFKNGSACEINEVLLCPEIHTFI